MKDLKEKAVMQELSKEEAEKTYGGKKGLALVVVEGGRLALVVVELKK